MIANVYLWANGYPAKVKAEEAGKEFERIEKKYGAVTRERVLEEAESVKNPLHSAFEWNDTKAAHLYRLHQAGDMIRHLVIEVKESDEEESFNQRAYVNVTKKAKVEGSYLNINVAMSNEETKEIVLKHAIDELHSFKEKYRKLKELERIFTEIDRLENVI